MSDHDHNGNGHANGRPRVFSAAVQQPSVPIVGQPFTVKAWICTISLRCNCDAHEPLLITGHIGAAAKCPACQNVYVLQSLQHDPATNSMAFGIGMARDVARPVQGDADGQ